MCYDAHCLNCPLTLTWHAPFAQAAFAGGKGDYHALQVKVERRYTRGFYLLNSFTWSRVRDNASGHLEVQNGDNSRRPSAKRPAAASSASARCPRRRPGMFSVMVGYYRPPSRRMRLSVLGRTR